MMALRGWRVLCILGDKLNAGGGSLSAVTAMACVEWMKFRELGNEGGGGSCAAES